tara:strand:+ start:4217 stop:4921 length:705 start_codon:yes stop_codon:yes gene_type:complete
MAKEGIWISMEILKLTHLTMVERYILADITHFHDNGMVYFKTNSTLAEECKSSRASITRAISNLVQTGHIKIEQIRPIRKLKPGILSTQSEALTTQPDALTTQSEALSTQSEALTTQSDAYKSKGKSKRKNKLKNKIKKGIVYPFEEKEFPDKWEIWKKERIANGAKKYTDLGEQGALHNLQKISNHDYKTAIAIINESISHGWRGLFALKRDKQQGLPEISMEEAIKWANNIR